MKAAFGQENRKRLLDEYFSSAAGTLVTAEHAWFHVYQLLLWTDQTTGLAHCYESDKSQPGKPWYARSLAFHSWLSNTLQVQPGKVSDDLDWLFKRAASELATQVLRQAERLKATATRQREPFEGREFPTPGQDPELVGIVRKVLGGHLQSEPSAEEWRELVQRIRQYLALDNKRKNLLGEGFEDVLCALVQRACPSSTKPHTRRLLHELPGFGQPRRGDKPNKVDLAILRPQMRTLVTAKWSVRADREKQFVVDFNDYVAAESDGAPFEYVFVTNEFDPARLLRACQKLAANAPMFKHVVHINTDALRATYGPASEVTMREVLRLVDSGRLISLERWLRLLV